MALVTAALAMSALPASAGDGGGPNNGGGNASGTNDGTNVNGNANDYVPPPEYEDGDPHEGPRCWYTPLLFTTQQEQRTDIRPEEQRPGRWGWLHCDDGRPDAFQFFPDDEPVDPLMLARSVRITPIVPDIQASPAIGSAQVVNLESWFWVDPADWVEVRGGTSAGTVTVTVVATPQTLVVNPGDGSAAIRCTGGGTPFNPAVAAESQDSDCTYTYQRPGDYTATVTVVYSTAWSSTIGGAPGPGGNLGNLTPPAESFAIQVAEGQAVVGGDGD